MNIDKLKYHFCYLNFINKLYDKSDQINDLIEFGTEVTNLLYEAIRESEVMVDENELKKNVQDKLNKIKSISQTESLYTYPATTSDGGSKRRRKASSGKRKRLSNKRRFSGRGSRYRAVISRRRR